MSLGITIKLLRTSAGLKQADLADRLRVSSNYISLVENCKRDPSLSFLRSLSDVLGVPIGTFLLGPTIDRADLTDYERQLVQRINDLILEMQRVQLQRRAQVEADG